MRVNFKTHPISRPLSLIDYRTSLWLTMQIKSGQDRGSFKVFKWLWGSTTPGRFLRLLHPIQFSDPITVTVYVSYTYYITHGSTSGLFVTASRRPSLVRIHRASCLDAKGPPFRYVLYSSVAHFWLWFCFQNVPSVATLFHIQPRSYVTNDRSMAPCMAGKSLRQALVWTEEPLACNMI